MATATTLRDCVRGFLPYRGHQSGAPRVRSLTSSTRSRHRSLPSHSLRQYHYRFPAAQNVGLGELRSPEAAKMRLPPTVAQGESRLIDSRPQLDTDVPQTAVFET